ncbi:LapA family protein [Kitasatospora sp. NPDC058965]|uniref:LapA family protein n=1 Tax=Kitasatospora sp. NPDC058965 TaxID=3346682 RepID=UPI00369E0517
MTKNLGGAPSGKKPSEIAGIPINLVVGVVAAALALWFLFANLERVQIQFWVFTVTAPLWIALLTTLLIGAVVGYVFKGRRDNR